MSYQIYSKNIEVLTSKLMNYVSIEIYLIVFLTTLLSIT